MALTPEQVQAIYKAVKEGKLSGKLPKRLQPIPDPEKASTTPEGTKPPTAK